MPRQIVCNVLCEISKARVMLTKEHQNKQLGEPPLYTTPLLPDMGLNIKPALLPSQLPSCTSSPPTHITRGARAAGNQDLQNSRKVALAQNSGNLLLSNNSFELKPLCRPGPAVLRTRGVFPLRLEKQPIV